MDDSLTLDDAGLEYTVVAIFPVYGKDYIALLPIDAEDYEVYLYRFIRNGDDDPEMENIDDDEEYNAIVDAYEEFVAEEE